MRTKEYYYTLERFGGSDFGPFVRHVGEYLAGERAIPITKAPSVFSGSMLFTFSDDMYRFTTVPTLVE